MIVRPAKLGKFRFRFRLRFGEPSRAKPRDVGPRAESRGRGERRSDKSRSCGHSQTHSEPVRKSDSWTVGQLDSWKVGKCSRVRVFEYPRVREPSRAVSTRCELRIRPNPFECARICPNPSNRRLHSTAHCAKLTRALANQFGRVQRRAELIRLRNKPSRASAIRRASNWIWPLSLSFWGFCEPFSFASVELGGFLCFCVCLSVLEFACVLPSCELRSSRQPTAAAAKQPNSQTTATPATQSKCPLSEQKGFKKASKRLGRKLGSERVASRSLASFESSAIASDSKPKQASDCSALGIACACLESLAIATESSEIASKSIGIQ